MSLIVKPLNLDINAAYNSIVKKYASTEKSEEKKLYKPITVNNDNKENRME